jgi:signal peptidase II
VWATTLTALVVCLDQITKQLAIANVKMGEPVEIIFGFELANVRNRGVAFGLLAGGEALVLALTGGALLLLLSFFAVNWRRPWLWLAVGLLTGGALGNLADRVRTGAVIDFLDFPIWPAFNLADVAIVAGVGTLLMVLSAPPAKHNLAAEGGGDQHDGEA